MTGEEAPHSRACGHRKHDHGRECNPNCPTCGGRPLPAKPYEWDAQVAGYRVKTFAGGTKVIHILPMIVNHRIIVSILKPDGTVDEMAGVLDAWCYSDFATASLAADVWNPDRDAEPRGWIKHPFSGRRNGEPWPAGAGPASEG